MKEMAVLDVGNVLENIGFKPDGLKHGMPRMRGWSGTV